MSCGNKVSGALLFAPKKMKLLSFLLVLVAPLALCQVNLVNWTNA